MASLSIKNVGPIKEVCFKLNKINVFIGPQSSGKSTIAKIISFCLWLEKDALIHQDVNYIHPDFFEKNLMNFHQLQNSFGSDSLVAYKSEILSFEYGPSTFHIQTESNFKKGKVGKNAYIPAERNIITLPGIITLPLGETNIKSFLSDWINIHSKYNQKNAFTLLNLNAKYYYNEELKQDRILLDEGKDISLNEASSGLQSVVPLFLVVDYLTSWIYKQSNDISVQLKKDIEFTIVKEFIKSLGTFSDLDEEDLKKIYEDENMRNTVKASVSNLQHLTEEYKDYFATQEQNSMLRLVDNITKPHFSNIIIEEPEQNLFPQTQVDLIKDILKRLNKERDNLVITTHSPYILYALNNCMLGALVSGRIPDNDTDSLKDKDSWVHPGLVSIWSLKDGTFYQAEANVNHTIQDEEGLIRNNYFNEVMQNVMGNFSNLLNYYE